MERLLGKTVALSRYQFEWGAHQAAQHHSCTGLISCMAPLQQPSSILVLTQADPDSRGLLLCLIMSSRL
jgi:hypothetical protein